MVRLELIKRSVAAVNKSLQLSPSYQCSQRYFCTKKNDSDSDNETKKKVEVKKVEVKKDTDAVNKLNILLQQMVEMDTSKPKLELAKPRNLRKPKTEAGQVSVKKEPVETKIVKAVKDVAESMGGDVKQTESELLSKLLNSTKSTSTDNGANLSEIVKGMKIDRETKAPESRTRAQQVQQILGRKRSQYQLQANQTDGQQRPMRRPRQDDYENIVHSEPVDIFGGEPLGIFTANFEEAEQTITKTWDKLYERELKLAVTHPPSNYFQEMILWTEQGKLWKFPINNEQGMEEEESVYFADHVFLEEHLEPWCPQKGPIRHFMELVCVGLSKNPYMSVKTKREHIEWYKNYFADKIDLLKDIGAIPTDAKKPKEIEAE